jgi:hypothetical protein
MRINQIINYHADKFDPAVLDVICEAAVSIYSPAKSQAVMPMISNLPTSKAPNEDDEVEDEKLIGGEGDGKKDSDFDPKQLEVGKKIEEEHSDDPDVQAEIAKDHLTEHGEYYTKLIDMEIKMLEEKLTDELDEDEKNEVQEDLDRLNSMKDELARISGEPEEEETEEKEEKEEKED